MIFTVKELAIANSGLRYTLRADGKLEDRLLKVDEMKDAIEICDKLLGCTHEKRVENGELVKIFDTDSDVEFTTSEKATILKFIERDWSVEDAKSFLSLKEKLS